MTIEDFPDLVFVHLSDIHFRTGRAGDAHDVDADIRNEIERDLRNLRTSRIPRIDGIIVSGDIAFSGKQDEFAFARSWIERICEQVECPTSGVMIVPGNHDVDRASAGSKDIAQLHDQVRTAATAAARDDALASILRNADQGPLLLSPTAAYNSFAATYGCAIKPDAPFWEREFPLGSQDRLRIRGLTSTLISGPLDDEAAHKLFYGGAQRQVMREANVWRVVVGHHPPSWVLDGEDAERTFSRRTILQLFGHKHDQWFELSGNSVRLTAGAVHPDRNEAGWEPRYSLIALQRQRDTSVALRVYPRRWSKEEMIFIGDYNSRGQDFRDRTSATDAA